MSAITFVTYGFERRKPDGITRRHHVKRVSLVRGEQGIPCGFGLTARCGAFVEVDEIDLEDSSVPDAEACEECGTASP